VASGPWLWAVSILWSKVHPATGLRVISSVFLPFFDASDVLTWADTKSSYCGDVQHLAPEKVNIASKF
jgi:hypothetical protein